MKHFINLTSRVINKLHIVEIIKQENSYEIHMSNSSLWGLLIFSSGDISTYKNIIEICDKNKQDYKTITDFINNET